MGAGVVITSRRLCCAAKRSCKLGITAVRRCFSFLREISSLTSRGVNVAAEVVEHAQQCLEEKRKYF